MPSIQFSDKSTEDFPVICYTDGSKIDGRVMVIGLQMLEKNELGVGWVGGEIVVGGQTTFVIVGSRLTVASVA
ncbi:hypothetical protein TNCV_1465131 [Trichonephila clavipes]|nr:hypothetical protein TNCV_1465131 [Trichonephila clavipes]